MFRFWRKSVILSAVFLLLFQTAVLAASAGISLSGVRYHNGSQYDRIVFDLDKIPNYNLRVEKDGKRIVLEFDNVGQVSNMSKPKISSDLIRKLKYEEKKGKLRVIVDLKKALNYRDGSLKNPARVFLDIYPEGMKPPVQTKEEPDEAYKPKPFSPEKVTQVDVAPGLKQATYVFKRGNDRLAAWFLFADPEKYSLQPVLANWQVPGRAALSDIARSAEADAAINASYFARTGEILGITKIDEEIAGTTYFTRSAMGIMPDGSMVFGDVSYYGTVTMGNVTLPVSGVDAERGENGLVIYNLWNGSRTGTNEFGIEFTVKDGKVTKIQTGNSMIPRDGMVISAHGSSKAAFSKVRVGDKVTVSQELGKPWNDAVHILGAGPCLVRNGKVKVTAAEEEFPSDIRYGSAPRSAVGLTNKGQFLLAVVDGRQSHSDGCTLTEWAELLKKFGAVEAINLDGGGSTEMVVEGRIVNSPSDGAERPVGSALVLTKK
ncbi:MAG TPA: exopolysaccharide biosynthesis protein [Selenomonas sp.]|nr:exopolysaccharide biosynthesis protein [Selenomonas sp.]